MSSATSLPSVRVGEQLPAWCRLPDGVVSSAAAEAIDLARVAGVELDPWQEWVLEQLCAEREGGTWAAFEGLLLVGRQNGKNAILEAREMAGGVLFDDELIIHTAHRGDAVMEHANRMVQLAESTPDFARLVKNINQTHGQEEIKLGRRSPSTGRLVGPWRRIKFVTRAKQPGRAFSGSCVVFDEAFDLNPKAIGAAVPTLSTKPNAQVIYTSSQPHITSSVLHSVIRRARSDDPEPRLFAAEWGNEKGTPLDDIDAWYRANPALGGRISEDYVRAEYQMMVAGGDPELMAEFARERVGIGEMPESDEEVAIPGDVWDGLAESGSRIDSARSWALVVADGGAYASIGVAGRRNDGKVHAEYREHKRGTGWILERVHEAWLRLQIPLRVPSTGATAAFIAPLREAGVEVVECPAGEEARSTDWLIMSTDNGELRHLGQRTLDQSLKAATTKRMPSGGRVWIGRDVRSDISAIRACTLAVGGVSSTTDVDPMTQFG